MLLNSYKFFTHFWNNSLILLNKFMLSTTGGGKSKNAISHGNNRKAAYTSLCSYNKKKQHGKISFMHKFSFFPLALVVFACELQFVCIMEPKARDFFFISSHYTLFDKANSHPSLDIFVSDFVTHTHMHVHVWNKLYAEENFIIKV